MASLAQFGRNAQLDKWILCQALSDDRKFFIDRATRDESAGV